MLIENISLSLCQLYLQRSLYEVTPCSKDIEINHKNHVVIIFAHKIIIMSFKLYIDTKRYYMLEIITKLMLTAVISLSLSTSALASLIINEIFQNPSAVSDANGLSYTIQV